MAGGGGDRRRGPLPPSQWAPPPRGPPPPPPAPPPPRPPRERRRPAPLSLPPRVRPPARRPSARACLKVQGQSPSGPVEDEREASRAPCTSVGACAACGRIGDDLVHKGINTGVPPTRG